MEYRFQDVQFMSAAEKKTTLRAWVRFLKNGLRSQDFTKGLYHHLIQHCSFIAHYNRAGFYAHYFESGDSTVHFLSQFDPRGPCLSVEYGYRGWLSGDYSDLNLAMVSEAATFIPALLDAARRTQRTADIAAAATLLARHGVTADGIRAEDHNDDPLTQPSKPAKENLPNT